MAVEQQFAELVRCDARGGWLRDTAIMSESRKLARTNRNTMRRICRCRRQRDQRIGKAEVVPQRTVKLKKSEGGPSLGQAAVDVPEPLGPASRVTLGCIVGVIGLAEFCRGAPHTACAPP